MKQFTHGFNLLEILISLSIICIFFTLSFSYFQPYFVRTHRLEAANNLLKLATALEQYHIENNTYENGNFSNLHFSEYVAKNNYQLIIQAGPDDYLLIAKPLAHQAEKDFLCESLTLNSQGEKNITGKGNVLDCWHAL